MSNRPSLVYTPPGHAFSRRPRVLLADDHVLFTEALAKILENEFEIVGTVPNGRLLLQQAADLCPDVILLDLSMPLMNGSEAGRRLGLILPKTRIIVLTASEDLSIASAALQSWASGFVLKKAAAEELTQAIRRVLQGKKYVVPSLRRKLQDEFIRDDLRSAEKELTPRQREVLQLLAEGYSMKEAANILAVAARTIAFHKYKIMDDLGLKTNADLLRLAIKERLMQTA
jgi:DNA-binding NarL/FixJ family response regulator